MKHETSISLPFALERDPPPFEWNDIKFPESLVRYFLHRYTKVGDRVFDPFAGLGTTLFVSEEMARTPYGIEWDNRRFEWMAGQLAHWQNVVHGDAARLDSYNFPKMDFLMTSPPFMHSHERWNPLCEGNPRFSGYPAYLKKLEKIFQLSANRLKRGAYCVIQVDNLQGRSFTPLVWDIGRAAAASLRLEAEIIVKWTNAPEGYPLTHCLILKKVPAR